MTEVPKNPIESPSLGGEDKPLDLQQPLNINPGETLLVFLPDKGVRAPIDEVQAVIDGNAAWNKLRVHYSTTSLEELQAEYKRIQSDFLLSMQKDIDLRAIRSILVETYNFDDFMLAQLNT